MLRSSEEPKSEFLTAEQTSYLAENIALIEFYDSFDRNFGNINSDAIAVIKKR